MLEKEIQIYEANLEGWLAVCAGRYVVIYGDKVVGFFPNEAEAFKAGVTEASTTPFLVRKVQAEQDAPVNMAYGLGILQCRS